MTSTEPTGPSNQPNLYCEALGIAVPDLAQVWDRTDANMYSRMIVALLEHGRPMTLEDVAARFEGVGEMTADDALRSLKRCRPGRSPIYRDEDLYALDPHDDEADLWVFRLGLRPPKRPPEATPRRGDVPLPSPDQPLTPEVVQEVWFDGIPYAWARLDVVICILDAHGKPMAAVDVAAFAAKLGGANQVALDAPKHWRDPCPVAVLDDDSWSLVPGHPRVRKARERALDRLALVRRISVVL